MLESKLYERTVQRRIAISGIGLFTGQEVHLTFSPAAPGTGILFRRMDLPHCPEIPAVLSKVISSPRCTTLATEHASIQMVEHVLSAVYALGVDNLLIEVAGPEIPSGDGSSLLFVHALEQAGIVEQSSQRKGLKIQAPISWSEGSVHLVALPADEFRVSFTLHYPQSKLIGSQFYSFVVNEKQYKEEIAPCRTFSLYEEIAPFIAKGLLKGGGLDNALVIKEDRVMNPEGARFPDEMVRHKVLDLIGDLALIGSPIAGHVIALRSGHASHIAFAKQLVLAGSQREESLEVFSHSYVLENC